MASNYSVLMSLYIKENPEFLKISIESMVNQELKPEEIIIVFDGPITPALEEVIDSFVELEPELFTLVKLEKNRGLGLALNEGIRVSRNELIARMDTDDISYLERCKIQVNLFDENPNLDIVGTLTSEFYERPENVVSIRKVPESQKDILKFSKRRSPFNHPTVMYKKSSVLKVGGYQNVIRNEDLDLFGRMLAIGCQAYNIQQELLYFRSNEDNFKRRKSWHNNYNYTKVIYNFWKKGYSSFYDFAFVAVTQLGMFIAPTWILKIVSDKVLREKK